MWPCNTSHWQIATCILENFCQNLCLHNTILLFSRVTQTHFEFVWLILKTEIFPVILQNTQRNAPINGLPQDAGAGQPTGIRLRKAHMGGDFDIHKSTVPRVENLTRPPSWKVERTWEWVSGPPSWKIPRSHLSEFPVSKDGWTKGVSCYFF